MLPAVDVIKQAACSCCAALPACCEAALLALAPGSRLSDRHTAELRQGTAEPVWPAVSLLLLLLVLVLLQRRAGPKGHGLYTDEDLAAGQFVIQYVGEVLEEEEYLRRKHYYIQTGQRHYYFMNIGNGEVIDACRKVCGQGALGGMQQGCSCWTAGADGLQAVQLCVELCVLAAAVVVEMQQQWSWSGVGHLDALVRQQQLGAVSRLAGVLCACC